MAQLFLPPLPPLLLCVPYPAKAHPSALPLKLNASPKGCSMLVPSATGTETQSRHTARSYCGARAAPRTPQERHAHSGASDLIAHSHSAGPPGRTGLRSGARRASNKTEKRDPPHRPQCVPANFNSVASCFPAAPSLKPRCLMWGSTGGPWASTDGSEGLSPVRSPNAVAAGTTGLTFILSLEPSAYSALGCRAAAHAMLGRPAAPCSIPAALQI